MPLPEPTSESTSSPARARAPSRPEIERRTVGRLRPPLRKKPDILVVDTDDGPCVVKDYSRLGLFHRLVGRLTLRREANAYEALEAVPAYPRLLGRIDADAIAVELVEAEPLAFAPRRFAEGPGLVDQLEEVLRSMEAVGVFNLDMNGRRNLMAAADGRLIALDLGGAVTLPPGTLRHRLFAGLLSHAHEGALLKYKQLWAPRLLTEEERRRKRRMARWRRSWIFSSTGGSWRG